MKLKNVPILKLTVFAMLFVFSTVVSAHVKWFSEYDLSQPPLPIGDIFNGQYALFFVGSVVFVYVFFWFDRYLYRNKFLVHIVDRVIISDASASIILRVASFLFFTSLFVYGLKGHTFYLTPELQTELPFVMWVHLAMAVFALSRYTTPVIGLLILLLYSLVIADYGLYHAIDYMVFVGLAYFFIVSATKKQAWLTSRFVILFASLGLNLCWLASEKWAFPHWTVPLLEQNPNLLLGMNPHFYMVLAGFVEFNIAFVLLSSASSFSRIVALGLSSIFVLAIYQFGVIDAVGHLFIIAILAILVLRGPTNARFFLVLSDKSLWAEAYFMTGLYVLALTMIFTAYYGLYFLLVTH